MKLPRLSVITDQLRQQHYPLGHVLALDGLRGAMTIGVVLAHVRRALVPGAIAFMDMFFAMSGYFITALLLREWDRSGSLHIGRFYRRRFLRIVPPFAAMIVVYILVCAWLLPDLHRTLLDAALASAYVMNLIRAGLLPQVSAPSVSYLGHTWSLALEEQFYLLWPWLLAVLLMTIGPGRRLLGLLITMIAAASAWRLWLAMTGTPIGRLYNGPDTRADALLVGCALAVGMRLVAPATWPRVTPWLKRMAWPLLALLIVESVWFFSDANPLYYYAGPLLLGALPGAMIILVMTHTSHTVLHTVFEAPALTFVGRIFYGVYLWHFPILSIMNWHFHLRAGTRAFTGIPLTFIAALLSYTWIERHFMRTTGDA